jgi:hypothetical protein
MNTRQRTQRRKGNILVLTAFMMIGMLAMVAFSVDLGYLNVARTELQRSADAAALAGAWELIDEDLLLGYSNPEYIAEHARITAAEFALYNPVTTQGLAVDQQDVLVGYLPNPLDPTSQLLLDSGNPPNAVQVRVRKSAELNGQVPLFFARALGMDGASMQAVATAALLTNIRGFRIPSSGENLAVLPFALDEQTWIALVEDHVGTDDWTWNPQTREVEAGGDDILEVNLFPQGTGSPGNRGTVDIGPSNNSTADLARQITDGITAEDLSYIGGKLELNEDGFLYLNGDTGISAGMKDELASIVGQPRTILIFREVNGNGNNATYTIVGFAGIRITDVKLTGNMSSKHVTIQPAITLSNGAIPETGDQVSHFVYSRVWLVR